MRHQRRGHPGRGVTTSPPHRRARRVLGQALGIAGLAALLLSGVVARPAQAHVAIVLLVLAPKPGQTVTADPEVVIYAQRTLLGVDQTAYTLMLDQRPIDPANPATTVARPGQIRVGQQARVPLRDLSPGAHRLTVSYRPDRDEPKMTISVTFTVRGQAGLPVVPIATGLGVVAAAVAVAAAWWARRRRLQGAAR